MFFYGRIAKIVFTTLLLAARPLAHGMDLDGIEGREFDLAAEEDWGNLATAMARGLEEETPKARRGREFMAWAASVGATNRAARPEMRRSIAEVISALRNNHRSPLPPSVDIFELPLVHRRYAGASVGLGNRVAANVSTNAAMESSLIDPPPSSFWKPPLNISALDLRTGFGRARQPAFEAHVWNYDGPKTGFGGHAGFEAKSGDTKVRIKFGEIHSEPFAARIFHALGFNVDPTDHVPALKVRFDARLFSEFNSRKPLDTTITTLGFLPVWTIRVQSHHDPFRCIAFAVLKDGRRIETQELRRLIEQGGAGQVDHVVTVAANVQIKAPRERSIGPWDFGQLGHERLRELRGAGLLAAWLGWFDSRFENTRLRMIETNGGFVLKHVFSDVGGGLGKCSGWSGWHGEDVDAFPDFFTMPEIRRGPGRMTTPFRVVNFRPIEQNGAFEEMTMEDARWMARLIARISGQQIRDALAASGLASSEVERFAAKLESRREKMLNDLGIQKNGSQSQWTQN